MWQDAYRSGDRVQVQQPDGSWVDGTVSAGFTPAPGFPVPVDLGGPVPWPAIDPAHIRVAPGA